MMNNYASLKTQTFGIPSSYQLVPLRYQDIFEIMNWRNAQLSILRQQSILTKDMQERYYQTVILPSFTAKEPEQLLFSYLLEGKCIGYGGIVHIDWQSKRGEVSFLLNPERTAHPQQYQKDFSSFLQLIKTITFHHLKFHRLFTETFDIRPEHIAILEEQGFAFEGRMKEHIWLEKKYIDSLIHGLLSNE